MRCFPQLLVTSVAEITPLDMRWSTSLSLWQTKEGHHTGKHVEPQCVVGFLRKLEKPRMEFRRSPRGSPHFDQLEQLFMNRGIFGIWQRLTRNLASLTMLGVALTRR